MKTMVSRPVHARSERRRATKDRLAWRAAASGGELHPGAVRDVSPHGIRLAVRRVDTPAIGAVIKVLLRGERYPRYYRVVHVHPVEDQAAELGCVQITGREFRAARTEAMRRVRVKRSILSALEA